MVMSFNPKLKPRNGNHSYQRSESAMTSSVRRGNVESYNAPFFTFGDWRDSAKRLGYKLGWAFYRFQETQQLVQGGKN